MSWDIELMQMEPVIIELNFIKQVINEMQMINGLLFEECFEDILGKFKNE